MPFVSPLAGRKASLPEETCSRCGGRPGATRCRHEPQLSRAICGGMRLAALWRVKPVCLLVIAMRRVSVLLAAGSSRFVLSLAAKAAFGRDAGRLAGSRDRPPARRRHSQESTRVTRSHTGVQGAGEKRPPSGRPHGPRGPRRRVDRVARRRGPPLHSREKVRAPPRRICAAAECVPCGCRGTLPRGQRA